jgi:hypothetical protein
VENPADVPTSNIRLALIALRSIEKNIPVSAVIASISCLGAIFTLQFLSRFARLLSRDITLRTFTVHAAIMMHPYGIFIFNCSSASKVIRYSLFLHCSLSSLRILAV